jgi:hypothetical protein
MHIVQLKALSNGAHPDLCSENITAPPDGWAVIPEGFPLPASFPFVDLQAEELPCCRSVEIPGEDGETIMKQDTHTVLTVTAMTDCALPDAPALTPSEQREEAYNTARIIPWEGGTITVTEAAQLWQYYAAEGNMKAYDLQALIAKAKSEIRAQYPDVEVAE